MRRHFLLPVAGLSLVAEGCVRRNSIVGDWEVRSWRDAGELYVWPYVYDGGTSTYTVTWTLRLTRDLVGSFGYEYAATTENGEESVDSAAYVASARELGGRRFAIEVGEFDLSLQCSLSEDGHALGPCDNRDPEGTLDSVLFRR